MMHKYFWAFLLAAFSLQLAQAQFTPQGFNYQSIVRTAGGAPLTNQTVTLLFTIRSGAPNGPVSYSEKQVSSTNEFGLVNLIIGRGTPLQGTFAGINWGGGAKFLTVSLETSPNVFDELGSSEMLSVPYALYAQNAANGGGGGTGDNWGTQSVQTNTTLSGNGTSGNPLIIARQGATTGQVLKWNGTDWKPADDVANAGTNGGTVTQINTGNGLTGGPISTSGTISLSNSGVTPGIYGSATQIPVITIDPHGRVTSVFTVVPQPGTVGITGTTGINVQQTGLNFTITNTGDTDPSNDLTQTTGFDGDVSGVYNNLQIKPGAVGTTEIADNAVGTAKIADNAVTAAKIADNAVGTAKIADNAVTAAKIADNAVGTAKIADNAVTTNKISNNAVTNAKIANGAVTASKLDAMGAANGQVLKWNGTSWAPASDAGITTIGVTAGQGISVTGTSPAFTVTNTGDTDATDDLTGTSTAGGDVSGTFSNLQIKTDAVGAAEIAADAVGATEIAAGAVGTTELANNAVSTTKIANGAITAAKLDAMGATPGQVLKWNGTAWIPDTDLNTGTGGGTGVSVVAGAGISVNQTGTTVTVINTGDTDGSDDLTNASTANGDVTGPFSNLQIRPGVVTAAELADNAVITPRVSNGAITGEKINSMGAANGQVLKWNGSVWSPASDESGNGGGDNWGTQSVRTGNSLTGDGTASNPLHLSGQGAASGQILKWNGNSWLPAADETGAGDDWGSQVIIASPTLIGNGTSANPLALAQQGAATGQVLKWNGSSWVPDNDLGGAGAGDNWGTQQVVTSVSLSGAGTNASPLTLAQQAAVAGQILKWNGAAWMPANDGGDNWGTQNVIVNGTLTGNGTAANPIQLAQQGANAGQILKWNGSAWMPANDAGDNWGTQNVAVTPLFSGNGTASNPLNLSQQGASSGQVLKWNGNSWAPANDEVSTGGSGGGSGNNYNPGAGISITGTAPNFTINNIGDADNNPSNELQTLSVVGNALTLSNGGGTVTIPGTNYTAGTGITINDNVISNSGDPSSTNELQTIALNGSQLLLSNGGGSVTLPTGSTYTGGTGINVTGNAPAFTIENTGDLSEINELQLLSISNNMLTLSQGGGTVALPVSPTYTAGNNISITGTGNNRTINSTADPSSTNELQTIALTGNVLTLSQGGGTVTLPTGTTYTAGTGISLTGNAITNTGDVSNTNEIQTLSLTGNTLALSQNGGTVTLPTGTTYTAGTGISLAGNAITNTGDVSNTNEIQTLSLTGNTLALSQNGGTVNLPTGTTYTAGTGIAISAGNVISNTGDPSSSNELQSLSLTGNTLTISGSNSSVDLSGIAGSSTQWGNNGTHIFNNNTGSVLIGTNTSVNGSKLQITGKGYPAAYLYGEGLLTGESVLSVVAEGKGGGGYFESANGAALTVGNGSVGIGTKDPKSKLDVRGDVLVLGETTSSLLNINQSNAAVPAGISLKNTGGNPWFIQGGNNEFSIENTPTTPSLANVRLMSFDVNRNARFGTPTSALRSFNIYHGNAGSGLLLQNTDAAANVNRAWEWKVNGTDGTLQLFNPSFGTAAAGTFAINGTYTPSDSRFKRDVQSLKSVLYRLMELRPVSYHYIAEGDNSKTSLGFLAQEVAPLFPELVLAQRSRDNAGEYLSLNYAGFSVLAVKAIQEQQSEIEKLKAENEALRQRLDKIEALLSGERKQ